jgi:spore photoproduct lyase
MDHRYPKLAVFDSDPIYAALTDRDRSFIDRIAGEYRLSVQEIRFLCDVAADLEMWGCGPIEKRWHEPDSQRYRGRSRARKAVAILRDEWDALKQEGPEYVDLGSAKADVLSTASGNGTFKHRPARGSLLGRCPVASPKTRCCNLLTLDAVLGCGYGCTYCSIQTFAGGGEIVFRSDLEERLVLLEAELRSGSVAEDPGSDATGFEPSGGRLRRLYHIGTGQSSDSLMFGNRHGLLDRLCAFADRNPDIILEFKTKSAAADPLTRAVPPRNVIAGWTLNPHAVITVEEPLTASLDARLVAARTAADNGIAVGFHFHPIIPFRGWRDVYADLYRRVMDSFSPEEVVMVSFGTVTLIKPVIRSLRVLKPRSRILQLPLTDAAGKLSIPLELKQDLFSHAYEAFAPWHGSVFFYLCMEDPVLWKPVFGYEYRSNEEFELAMKRAYAKSLGRYLTSA